VSPSRSDIFISSAPNTYQIVLSTAHPAKFSEAVSRALENASNFDFDRDVLPAEFRGLLEKERRVLHVERPDVELVKEVIEETARRNA
jgi:threonine synthase